MSDQLPLKSPVEFLTPGTFIERVLTQPSMRKEPIDNAPEQRSDDDATAFSIVDTRSVITMRCAEAKRILVVSDCWTEIIDPISQWMRSCFPEAKVDRTFLSSPLSPELAEHYDLVISLKIDALSGRTVAAFERVQKLIDDDDVDKLPEEDELREAIDPVDASSPALVGMLTRIHFERPDPLTSQSGYALVFRNKSEDCFVSCPVSIERDAATRTVSTIVRVKVAGSEREVVSRPRTDLFDRTNLEIVAWVAPAVLEAVRAEMAITLTFSSIEVCRKTP